MNVCYVAIPGAAKGKRMGIVVLEETGYYLTDYDYHETEEQVQEHVRLLNKKLGVSPAVEESMMDGSMFGWDCPAAQLALNHFRVNV